jgi:hypothetical protein
VPLFFVDTLRNPAENPNAFILLIVAITTVLALVIMVVILVFMSSSEEDQIVTEEGEAVSIPREPPPVREPWIPEATRRRWAPVFTLGWVIVVAAIWVIGGFASRPDAVCLSCHVDDSPHEARLDRSTATVDPHESVRCASCHETPNLLLSVTTAVPGRAIHYVGGAIGNRYAEGYGSPVANSSCTACHREALVGTITDVDRGLRMSHKEPLELKPLCIDCHEASAGLGVVNQFTVGMEPCIRCHDAEVASAECSYCHIKDPGSAIQVKTDFKPKTHAVDCSGCHELTTCDSCHGIRMPHTTPFMGAGHAREAVEDIWFNGGRVCKGCHTETRRPCGRCHGGTFPAHPPSYMIQGHKSANPFANGCDECHEYRAWVTGRNFCGNCHPQWATRIQQ